MEALSKVLSAGAGTEGRTAVGPSGLTERQLHCNQRFLGQGIKMKEKGVNPSLDLSVRGASRGFGAFSGGTTAKSLELRCKYFGEFSVNGLQNSPQTLLTFELGHAVSLFVRLC